MLAELLSTDRENATRTGKELANYFNCDIRTITEQIERERRQGQPICANPTGGQPGYYLAADAEELENYCKRLHHRAAELYKTRQALLAVLKGYAAVKSDAGGVNNGKE